MCGPFLKTQERNPNALRLRCCRLHGEKGERTIPKDRRCSHLSCLSTRCGSERQLTSSIVPGIFFFFPVVWRSQMMSWWAPRCCTNKWGSQRRQKRRTATDAAPSILTFCCGVWWGASGGNAVQSLCLACAQKQTGANDGANRVYVFIQYMLHNSVDLRTF